MTMHKQITSLILVGILSGILSLLGCQQKKQSAKKIIKQDTTTFTEYYPKDHKLTREERKDFSNRILKQKGIPILESLPFVDDYKDAKFRNEKEVAKKAVVLYGLIYVANEVKTSKEMIEYFKKYDLWNAVSPEERQYLE